MIGLKITKQVVLSFSAERWELYTSSFPVECEEAAAEINIALEDAVNAGKTRREVYAAVEPVFKKFAHLGARDSEPMYKLDYILDEVFGK